MARQMRISTKHLAIDKANSTVLIAVGVAAFISVFSLVACRALLAQRSYQSKVISQKETALKQLKTNVSEFEKLSVSYKEFEGATTNILGGNPKGGGDKDGENPRLILDALPSKYDFPALTTGLNKLVTSNGFTIDGISGTDDEITQAANTVSGSPTAIEIPFTLSSSMEAAKAKNFLEMFERSIRPVQVSKVSIGGEKDKLKVSITAKTYFQPGKSLDIKSVKVPSGKTAATKPAASGAAKK